MLKICQENQLRLSQQFEQGKLPHAVLIQGLEGSGKQDLANWLINLILCQRPVSSPVEPDSHNNISHACGQCKTCLLANNHNYPDHMLLASNDKSLGVDDIRRSNMFLQKTAHIGKSKTILIPQAQMMTVAAANALLKTLEEPCANSYIVLLANDLDTLLPTVISRCSLYNIKPQVGQALLAQINSSVDHCNTAYINTSQLAELTDKDTLQAFELFNQSYLNFIYLGKEEGELLNQLVNNKHGVRWLEKITCNLIRKKYQGRNFQEDKKAPGYSSYDHININPQMLNDIYQAIISCNKLIKSYSQTNRQFVCEQLIMTIYKIVKP
jgi:DNA polymerase-3 subunit delta'